MFLIERFFKRGPQTKDQETTPEEWKDLEESLSHAADRMRNDPHVFDGVEEFTRQATGLSAEKLGRRIGESPNVIPKNEFGKSSIYSFGELSKR